jgi:hypothetical protein
MTVEGGEPFNWSALVPHVVHPFQVAIIEALVWMGQPLSASDLSKLFDDDEYYVTLLSYHAVKLAKYGILEMAGKRYVRGSVEKFYFFR